MALPPAQLPFSGAEVGGPLYDAAGKPTYPSLMQWAGFGNLPFLPFGGLYDNFQRANSLLNGSQSTSGHTWDVVGAGAATAQVQGHTMRAGADTGGSPSWVNNLYAFVNMGANIPYGGGAFEYLPITSGSANNPNVNITTLIMGNGTAIANWLHLEINPTFFAFGIFNGSSVYSGDLIKLPIPWANIGGGPYRVGMIPTYSGGFVTSVLLDIPGYSLSDPRMSFALPSPYLGTINAEWVGYQIRPDVTENPDNAGAGGAAGAWKQVWAGVNFAEGIRGALGAASMDDLALAAGAADTGQELNVTPFPLTLEFGPAFYTVAYGAAVANFTDYALAATEIGLSIRNANQSQNWNFNLYCDSVAGLQSYTQTIAQSFTSPAPVPLGRVSWDGDGALLAAATQLDIELAATEVVSGSCSGTVMTVTTLVQGGIQVGEVFNAPGLGVGGAPLLLGAVQPYGTAGTTGTGGTGTYAMSVGGTVGAGSSNIVGAVPTTVNVYARGSVTPASVAVPYATPLGGSASPYLFQFAPPTRTLNATVTPASETGGNWVRAVLATPYWDGYGFGGRFQLLVTGVGGSQVLDLAVSCGSGLTIAAIPSLEQFMNVASNTYFLDEAIVSWDNDTQAVVDFHIPVEFNGFPITFTAINPVGQLAFPASLTTTPNASYTPLAGGNQSFTLPPLGQTSGLPTQYVASPTSAGSLTVAAGISSVVLQNSASLTTYTINLPPSATDGFVFEVSTIGGVAATTWGAGAGQSFASGWTPSATALNGVAAVFRARMNGATLTWNPA
jgi:hypothetical protein